MVGELDVSYMTTARSVDMAYVDPVRSAFKSQDAGCSGLTPDQAFDIRPCVFLWAYKACDTWAVLRQCCPAFIPMSSA